MGQGTEDQAKGENHCRLKSLKALQLRIEQKGVVLSMGEADEDQRSGLLATGYLTSGKSSEIPFPFLPFVCVAPRSFQAGLVSRARVTVLYLAHFS